MYGCIFVCFTTRAIHIEDVGSLEADDFIQALRRFVCTRGATKEIWSDNGTNFVAGEKEVIGHPHAFVKRETLVFLTVDLFAQGAKIQTIANRSRQVIYCSNGKVSRYPLVCSKTLKSTRVSSGAEGKFWPTIFGRNGFVNTSLCCKKERSGY